MSPNVPETARVKRLGQPFNPFKMFTGIMVPEPLVKYRGLSPGAKITWGRLARYAGENGLCYPAVPTLAREIGISTTQARTYIRELRMKEFIAIEQRSGTSGVYTFLWHEAFMGEIGEKRKIPPLRKTDRVPSRKTDRVSLSENRKATLSENRQRRESLEESHHQESQSEESQSPELNSTQQKTAASVASEPKSFSPNKSVDDDERPRPNPFREGLQAVKVPAKIRRPSAQMEALRPAQSVVRGEDTVYASPTDELLATVEKRTGQHLTFRVLDRITTSLESKGVTIPDFLAAVRLQNLEAIHSVPAFLTDFARGFLSANKKVVSEVAQLQDRAPICELGI